MNENKNISIIAYILPVGWMVAFVSRYICDDHSDFTNFHLRQGLGLIVEEMITYLLVSNILELRVLWEVLTVVFLVLIIYGIMGALNGQKRYQPILGGLFERLFKFLK